MPNPQQPELRRSENVPALNPDAMEAELEAADDVDLDKRNVAPGDRRPGEHSGPDQDKPDPDDVAEGFGVRAGDTTD